ncbi:helix-turn-helix transcriptional regulator [Streptomyces sp. BPTC-684]|uniref:helix-turn-helix domain-containing protein n=1 Tax=Streptomyces sp. BPTC-684 TaxID=3043734 RepID=UPI0024B27F89|nr:helix-turn-helix transcriptional regulator [Streptomyces sp. BPTC-684]WHM37451.1 helix-turn-helix transcriptional regulator [Streptomyces sp. BPTC-684]
MTQRDSDAGYEDEDQDDVPEWTDHVMATVAAEVRRRRKELRMSAQDLADRCEELGHPIPRNVIANMESGRRANLPLVDVMVLAKALRTNPICLIYPIGYVAEVQRLPYEQRTAPWEAMCWFIAQDSGSLADRDMLGYQREHIEALGEARSAMDSESYAQYAIELATSATERTEALRDQATCLERIDKAKQRLRVARSFIRRGRGLLPYLPPELADVDPPQPGSNANTTEENDL